jgi:hypothetical protein
MKKMDLSSIIMVTLILLAACTTSPKQPLQNNAATTLDSLQRENRLLKDSLARMDRLLKNSVSADDADLNNAFRDVGIEHARTTITNDLLKRTDLLPPGELGGTMRYERVVIVNRNWAIATASDGHVLLNMLFQYTVKPGGNIKWKVLRVDEE